MPENSPSKLAAMIVRFDPARVRVCIEIRAAACLAA
jgi:hypothetical protein